MPRRPTPSPGEGGRPPVSVQETAAAPVEKKKVDAAFWEKYQEVQKLPARERVEAILAHHKEYFPEGNLDPNILSGDTGRKMTVSAWVLAHPGRDRFAAAELRWQLERKLSFYHRSERHDDLRARWDEMSSRFGKTANVLENAARGQWPSDKEFSDEDILFTLHQGSFQRTEGLFTVFEMQGVFRDKAEGIEWLESMDADQLRTKVFAYHDLYEQAAQQNEKTAGDVAREFMKQEIKKWREGKGKGQ